MNSYGEFDFIAHIRKMFAELPTNSFEGIGDDCSVLPIGDEALVLTADMLNEGVHFLTDKSTPFQIGYKSVMVNISDVAAMGATPVATLLSLALPKERFGEWAEEFMRGYRAASAKYGVALVGGDTTKSDGGICINVTAIGCVALNNVKRRSAANVGDVIAVTGCLGASASGLRDVFEGNVGTANATIHLMPEAQVAEGVWLGKQESVHAMMDISDGIASDIQHILKESNVGVVVSEGSVPIAEGATFSDALCGGEDYQLLLTIDADDVDRVCADFQREFGKPLYIIGRVVVPDEANCVLRIESENGDILDSALEGYRHF